MNFSRKTILVVGAALLAACGDKVTISDPIIPTPPAPKVNFVEVTPATATVNTGGSITFTAAVNADVGLATSVTWSASAGAVTSAGVFTAPSTANPGVSVCAASTVDTGKKGCASVVVTAASAPSTPATVSINSITMTGNLGATVNPNNVAGNIDVTLNVLPGNQQITKVELYLGGTLAGSQTMSAAQSAALRYAADEAVAAQTAFPQIVFTVNTAMYTIANGVATPSWYNGPNTLQARVYTAASGTNPATASVSMTLNLANLHGFVGSLVTTGGNSANDALGYTWRSGGVTVTAIPVIYQQGLTLRSATVLLGGATCGTNAGMANTNAVAAGTALASPIEFVLANTATYEFRNRGVASGCDALYRSGGEIPTIMGITNELSGTLPGQQQNNNLLTVAGGFLNSPALSLQPDQNLIVRLDNRGPSAIAGAMTIASDTMSNQTNWVNALYRFKTGYTAPVDSGVSLGSAIERQFFAGPTGTAGVPASTTIISSDYTSTTDLLAGGLPNSVDNVTYNVAANVKDFLSNALVIGETVGAGTHVLATFGVDKQTPVLTVGGAGFAAGFYTTRDTATVDVAAGQTIQWTGVDSLSGFIGSPTAMNASMARLRPNITSGWLSNTIATLDPTVAGAAAVSKATPFTSSAAGFLVTPATAAYTVIAGPPIAIQQTTAITFGATTPAGYYITQSQVRDQAGNASSIGRKMVYVNNGSVPQITGLNAVTGPYTGGATVSFPASAQDSVKIVGGRIGLVYPVLGSGNNVYIPANRENPAVQIKFQDNGGMPVAVPFTVAGFIRNMQGMTASVGMPTTTASSGAVETVGACGVGAANRKPTTVTGRVYNGWLPSTNSGPTFTGIVGAGATGYSGEFAAPVLSTQVQAGVCFASAANFDSLSVAIGASTVVGTVSTRTVTFAAWGAGGNQTLNGGRTPFPSPFTNAQLSLLFNSGALGDLEWVQQSNAASYIGGLGLPFPTLDNGVIRNYQWTFTVSRTTGTLTSLSVLGVSSLFDGLVSVPTLQLAW